METNASAVRAYWPPCTVFIFTQAVCESTSEFQQALWPVGMRETQHSLQTKPRYTLSNILELHGHRLPYMGMSWRSLTEGATKFIAQHLIPSVSHLLHAREVYTERENRAWTFQLTWVARNRLMQRQLWVFCVKCQRKEIKETYFWRLGCPVLFIWFH